MVEVHSQSPGFLQVLDLPLHFNCILSPGCYCKNVLYFCKTWLKSGKLRPSSRSINEKKRGWLNTSLKSTGTRDELSITLYLQSEINFCSVRMLVNA